ncbi:MAG TPA: DUF2784 domain-containing protein [Candidatus Acidoferrales bacterium]|nr:DUF2784 domain-containing protein [Candidatus Acidoferrales bacterium]
MSPGPYLTLADAALAIHLLYIAWVIFGAFFTRGKPKLAAVHIASIVWGIITETTNAPCPLTIAENWCEARAGITPYHGPFLLHYLDATVYPNVPQALLVSLAVAVCGFNLLIYVRRAVLGFRR